MHFLPLLVGRVPDQDSFLAAHFDFQTEVIFGAAIYRKSQDRGDFWRSEIFGHFDNEILSKDRSDRRASDTSR